MRMTTELTETATAVQSLPSLLYAAIRYCCCCCCSFFRHRQLGCSFSCLSLPALPLRPGAGLAAHPVTRREAVPGLRSGRVKSSQLQTRTASDRSPAQRGWWPTPGFPSRLPATHLDIILHATKVPTYLPRYVSCPVVRTGAPRLHNTYDMPS